MTWCPLCPRWPHYMYLPSPHLNLPWRLNPQQPTRNFQRFVNHCSLVGLDPLVRESGNPHSEFIDVTAAVGLPPLMILNSANKNYSLNCRSRSAPRLPSHLLVMPAAARATFFPIRGGKFSSRQWRRRIAIKREGRDGEDEMRLKWVN